MVLKFPITVFFLLLFSGSLSSQILDDIHIPYWGKNTKAIVKTGKVDFGDITYKDSLINYFVGLDTIEEGKHYYLVNAIYGLDTLQCNMSKAEYLGRTMIDNVKLDAMYVESKIPPYKRYQVIIQDLSEDEKALMVDSARNKQPDSPVIISAPQTCLSYAFECLFRFHQINPEPICYRRTMYPLMSTQLEPFLETFCIKQEEYKAKKKAIRKVVFPDKSILVFRNKNGEIIHGVYCMEDLTYSKNGQGNYIVYNHAAALLDEYEYSSTVTVYTLNKDKFKIN